MALAMFGCFEERDRERLRMQLDQQLHPITRSRTHGHNLQALSARELSMQHAVQVWRAPAVSGQWG
jgi:hypothetical protein